jgi:hypothetical protein
MSFKMGTICRVTIDEESGVRLDGRVSASDRICAHQVHSRCLYFKISTVRAGQDARREQMAPLTASGGRHRRHLASCR